ncbi:MAG: DNA-binding domain-containing protein [Planctomycetota bacterium]
MTAALKLADTPPAESPEEPFDPKREIWSDQAADRLGVHPNSMSRRCRQWERQGLARKAIHAQSRRQRWAIARRADAKLAAFDLDAEVPEELNYCTRKQQRHAKMRAACVKEFRLYRRDARGTQKQWWPVLQRKLMASYPDLGKITLRSLRRRDKDYQSRSDITKLVDGRGRSRDGQEDPRAWDFFREQFLDAREPSKHSCWERTQDEAKRQGWVWCSYDACRKKIDDIIPPELQAQVRTPEVYRNAFRGFLEQDPEAYEAGERWDGDHSQLDFFTWHEGLGKAIRPWLTLWLDWRSRRVVGWCLGPSPNSTTILAAFKMGMLDDANLGGPDVVWIDNGKDYDSYALQGETKAQRRARQTQTQRQAEDQERRRFKADAPNGLKPDTADRGWGMFEAVGVETHFTEPYSPTSKGRVERFFGTLHDQFDRSMPGYCGKDSNSKPEELDALLKTPWKLPSFDHVKARLSDYIEGYNAKISMNRKGAIGMSPDESMAQSPRPMKVYDERELEVGLSMWHKPVPVGRNGITIYPTSKGQQYGRFDPFLAALKTRPGQKSKRVMVSYDPNDLVWSLEGKLLGVALHNQHGYRGERFSREDLAQAQKERRQYEKAAKAYRSGSRHEYLTDAEVAAEKNAERQYSTRDDRPLKLAQTPLQVPDDPPPIPDPPEGFEDDESILDVLSKLPDEEGDDQDDECDFRLGDGFGDGLDQLDLRAVFKKSQQRHDDSAELLGGLEGGVA